MSMKHPTKHHARAAQKRRALRQKLKEEKKARRLKLRAARK
jgi:hypothetical protein